VADPQLSFVVVAPTPDRSIAQHAARVPSPHLPEPTGLSSHEAVAARKAKEAGHKSASRTLLSTLALMAVSSLPEDLNFSNDDTPDRRQLQLTCVRIHVFAHWARCPPI
jgi:hypothetical protein